MSETKVKMKLKEIPIEKIDIGETNVRRRQLSKGLDELKRSLQLIGLQQPILVFKKNNRFELIIGQRRFIAASQLGWKKIPALIRSPANLTQGKIISMSENIHRVRLSPRDMSEVCDYLFDELGTPKAVADALGVGQATVNKYLSYHRIAPEPIKKLVDQKKITVPDAMKIVANVWPDEEKAVKIAEKMAKMTRPEKERVFDAVREIPEESADKIIETAEKAAIQKEIVIHLSEDYASGLDKASKDLNVDPEDIAKNVVVEWLEENGYV